MPLVDKSPIAVLGAGSWGTALAILLAANGHPTYLWGRNKSKIASMAKSHSNQYYLPDISFPEKLQVTSDMEQAITEQVRDILIVVPASAMRETLQQIKPYLHPQNRIIWACKGLEPGTAKWIHEVIEEECGKDFPKAILSGPSFAKEVANGAPTAIVLASDPVDFAKDFRMHLVNAAFRVYTTNDVLGVELGGACKNILAIAVGICDGLQLGTNARAALITRGLAEIRRLGLALGCEAKTLMGLSGLGDIVLSCTDDQSRNRKCGLAIGRGASQETIIKEVGHVIEGMKAAKEIYTLSQQADVEMPIVEMVTRVLSNEIKPEQAVHMLLARELRSE